MFCPLFTLILIYKPSLESIRPKSAILSPKRLQKLTKVVISQNPISPKCHSPKSLLLLHFSTNLSETFRINVNMDFANWSLFGDRMADLGLIDSKLGVYIKINVNTWQNKFEVHISKNMAKMAILWPKIGQRHFGARASHGHNLAIFHQILTNKHTKMTSSLRRIEWNKILSSMSLFNILVFWPHFCSKASHGQCCTYGLKTTLKLLVHVLAIMASSYLKIVF